MITLIGGEKGGTGKTTIAINIATKRILNGFTVLLVDADKQLSSSMWCKLREKNNIFPKINVIQSFGNEIIQTIGENKLKYTDIVIDTGGRDSLELRSAMLVADKLLIPVQASQLDIWTLSKINDLVHGARKCGNKKLTGYIVINRATTNRKNTAIDKAKKALKSFDAFKLIDIAIYDRVIYRDCLAGGLSMYEVNAWDKKPKYEFNELISRLYE